MLDINTKELFIFEGGKRQIDSRNAHKTKMKIIIMQGSRSRASGYLPPI